MNDKIKPRRPGNTKKKGPEKRPEGALQYNRREAMAALVKYSGALGGAATIVVTAEGLVSEASAYNCPPTSNAPHCNNPFKVFKNK